MRGVLTYDVWESQREVLNALEGGADLVGMTAGYRSGKSILGGRWLIANALAYPGTRHLAMGQDFTKAWGATYRVLFSQLPGENIEMVGPEQSPIVEDFNQSRYTLTFTNGSVIVLGSGDRWSRHAGDEFASIWVDEVAHIQESVHDILEMLGSRLTSDREPNQQVWTTTPAGYNDVYEILSERQDVDGEALGLDIELVRASVLDNPYLDDEMHERLRRQFGGTAREQQALHGGFTDAVGRLLTRDMLEFISVDDVPETDFSYFVGVDLATEPDVRAAEAKDTDWWACALVAFDGAARVAYLVDVVRERGLTLSQGVRWLQSIMRSVPTASVIAEDNQAQTWFVQAAREAGLRVEGVTNSVSKEQRILDMSVLFENGQVKVVEQEGVDWVPFVREWTSFPGGKADQLDAVELALSQANRGGSVSVHGGYAYGSR